MAVSPRLHVTTPVDVTQNWHHHHSHLHHLLENELCGGTWHQENTCIIHNAITAEHSVEPWFVLQSRRVQPSLAKVTQDSSNTHAIRRQRDSRAAVSSGVIGKLEPLTHITGSHSNSNYRHSERWARLTSRTLGGSLFRVRDPPTAATPQSIYQH